MLDMARRCGHSSEDVETQMEEGYVTPLTEPPGYTTETNKAS